MVSDRNEWLRGTVPSLTPWEGITLMTLEGDQIPKHFVAIGYFPHDDRNHFEADRIVAA